MLFSLFIYIIAAVNQRWRIQKKWVHEKKIYIKKLKWNMITVWINNTKEIFANAMEVPGEWWPFLDIQVQCARCMTITSWELYNNFSNIYYVYLQCLMESCQNEKESKFINFSEAFWAVKTIYHFHKCNQQTRHTKYGSNFIHLRISLIFYLFGITQLFNLACIVYSNYNFFHRFFYTIKISFSNVFPKAQFCSLINNKIVWF